MEKSANKVEKWVHSVCGLGHPMGWRRAWHDLQGKSVKPLPESRAQRIIHKAVLGYAAQSGKTQTGNAHPKMGALARCVGPHMAGMCGRFVQYLKPGGLQRAAQALLQLGSGG
jgi:hypothetical protein